MYTLSHTFFVDAAHHLLGLPAGHKCSRIHGHRWAISVGIASDTLDSKGMVMDLHILHDLCHQIQSTIDHDDINKVWLINPTCENIAEYIYNWMKKFDCFDPEHSPIRVVYVEVEETPGNSASYTE